MLKLFSGAMDVNSLSYTTIYWNTEVGIRHLKKSV